ncbi:hypothetical protein CRV08_00365 [Halarcobacter ebronensis]|uniref:HTH araC/xylS-type domain-containing protein n=1 Tax=Halarcobacter ebronensis TaxID=1462615 RepID=A0A4Q0YLQ8_9BACT|nr:hypothetical protein CRV08_00365 [Halarcobacter ebronensis]
MVMEPVPKNESLVTRNIHRHPFYEMIFVIQGELTIEVDLKKHFVKEGSILLFSPLQIHHPEKVTKKYTCVLIRFYPMLFENADFLKDISVFNYDLISLNEEYFNKCRTVLKELIEEFNSDLPLKNIAIGNLLKNFLIALQRSIPEDTSEKSVEDVFSKFNYLIVENEFKIAKPSYYAEELRISSRSLNEITKRNTGFAAGEYIKSKTIFEAQRLLCYTSLTVKEIAYALGFDAVAYFSRFFKKAANISAIEYRKEFLSNNKVS